MTIFFEIQEVNVWIVNSQSIIVVIITAPILGNPKLSDRMIWKGKTCGGDSMRYVQIQKLYMWWGFNSICTNTKAKAEKITNCGNLSWGGEQASLGLI